jgi:hypothetical protein
LLCILDQSLESVITKFESGSGLWVGEYLVQRPDNTPTLGVGSTFLILALQDFAHPAETLTATKIPATVKLRLEHDGVVAPFTLRRMGCYSCSRLDVRGWNASCLGRAFVQLRS